MQMVESQTDMQTLEGRIDGMERKLDTLNTNVLTLQGSIMSRAEVYAEDAKRVSLDRFEGETNGIRERLTRLESGPQKMLGWIALLVSGSVGCLSVFFAAIGVGVGILALIATVIIAMLTQQ